MILEPKLTPDDIRKRVKAEMANISGRTLWLLTKSVFSICDCDDHPDCRSCKDRLNCLFSRGQYSKTEIAEKVQDILFLTNKLCTSIQAELGSKGTILIVPPIPALVVQEAAFRKHSDLHRMCNKYKCPCASDGVLFGLHIFYNILCDAWSSLATEWLLPFGKQSLFREFQASYRGRNLVSIKNDESYGHIEQDWTTMLKVLFQMAFEGSLSVGSEAHLDSSSELSSLPSGSASDQTSQEVLEDKKDDKAECDTDKLGNSERDLKKKNQKNRFEHCVIVGTSSFFTYFKELVEDMSVSFLEESMDMDDEGVEVIKKAKDKYPKNSIWLIVRGVSEIAELTDVSPKCKAEKCFDPLYVFIMKNSVHGHPDFQNLSFSEMADKVLSQSQDFGVKVSEHLDEASVIFLSPIIPVAAYFGGNNSALSHEKLHEIADKDPNTPILVGSSKDWMSAVQELDRKWMQMILNNLGKDSPEYDIVRKLVKGLSNLLIFSTTPQKNPRLEKVQTIWGNNMRALISSFLGLKDSKKSAVTPPPSKSGIESTSSGENSYSLYFYYISNLQ